MATISKHNNPTKSKSLSSSTSNISVIKATIWMNIRIYLRYKANFIGGLVEISIMVLSFWLFAQVVQFRDADLFYSNPGEDALFLFFLAGIIMMFFQNSALYTPVNSVTRDLYNGTMEAIFVGPQSRYAYLIGNIIADILSRQIFMIPMMGLLILFIGVNINLLYIMGVLALFFLLVTSVGVIISLSAIQWKQVGNLVGIIGILVQFFGGIFIPVQSFPQPLQYFAILIPFTLAFDLMRYYVFDGNWKPLLPIEYEWLIIIITSIFYFYLSKILLVKVEKYAKKSGLHIL